MDAGAVRGDALYVGGSRDVFDRKRAVGWGGTPGLFRARVMGPRA